MVLEPGADAPAIRAENQWGETVTTAFREPTVLYFYPKDHTPGCTTEATAFNDRYDTYADAGVEVYGVSPDDAQSHCDFAETHDLAFDLLVDSKGAIAEAFDVPTVDGRPRRTTFVLVGERVLAVYEGVRPEGHAAGVLRDLKEAGLVEMS